MPEFDNRGEGSSLAGALIGAIKLTKKEALKYTVEKYI